MDIQCVGDGKGKISYFKDKSIEIIQFAEGKNN